MWRQSVREVATDIRKSSKDCSHWAESEPRCDLLSECVAFSSSGLIRRVIFSSQNAQHNLQIIWHTKYRLLTNSAVLGAAVSATASIHFQEYNFSLCCVELRRMRWDLVETMIAKRASSAEIMQYNQRSGDKGFVTDRSTRTWNIVSVRHSSIDLGLREAHKLCWMFLLRTALCTQLLLPPTWLHEFRRTAFRVLAL